jgi:hypothetical protein
MNLAGEEVSMLVFGLAIEAFFFANVINFGNVILSIT